MGDLAELERAAEVLPASQRAELMLFLAASLRRDSASLPEPRLFSTAQMKAWMDEDESAMQRFQAGA